MKLEDLSNVFDPNDVKWRMQRCGVRDGNPWGICLAYITNRAIMNRLDEVVGIENWKNMFTEAPNGGILCGISIKINDEWVTKWDGADNTDIEAVKGGLSSSMKRAAVQWGIGRYLYNLKDNWATFSQNGQYAQKIKDHGYFKWDPPALPDWALPRAPEKKSVRKPEKVEPKNEAKDDTQLNEDHLEEFQNLVKEYDLDMEEVKSKLRKEFSTNVLNKSIINKNFPKIKNLITTQKIKEL